MAGSYNHVVTDQGNLVTNERFPRMIENLGDAFEAVEEMYGMIWWLAYNEDSCVDPAAAVEAARVRYKEGLALARTNKDKGKHRGR